MSSIGAVSRSIAISLLLIVTSCGPNPRVPNMCGYADNVPSQINCTAAWNTWVANPMTPAPVQPSVDCGFFVPRSYTWTEDDACPQRRSARTTWLNCIYQCSTGTCQGGYDFACGSFPNGSCQ